MHATLTQNASCLQRTPPLRARLCLGLAFFDVHEDFSDFAPFPLVPRAPARALLFCIASPFDCSTMRSQRGPFPPQAINTFRPLKFWHDTLPDESHIAARCSYS
eukprot:jgi/Botrbrau1/9088/Bobra.178_2s0019.1